MLREFLGIAQTFGSEGCQFGSRISVTVASNSTVYIPAGAWVIETDSHTTCKFTYDNGTTWITWIGTSLAGTISSDGFLVAFVGDSTGGTAHRSQLLGIE